MAATTLSVRESLGGRWAWDRVGWAIMLVPGVVVVALQEASLVSATGWTLVGLIVGSSIAQSVAAGAGAALIASVARRRRPVIAPALVVVMWLTIGVVRGFVAGAVAQAVTGESPQFVVRVTTWVLVSMVWMPLFTYTAAQIEHRRRMLAGLAALRTESAEEESRAQLSAEELRDSIVATITDRIHPVIEQIRRTLAAVSGRSDVAALQTIGEQLREVSQDTERVLSERTTGAVPADETSARSPIAAALIIEPRHPVRTSLLTGVALLPVLVPMALMTNHPDAGVDILAALSATVATLTITAFLRRRFLPAPRGIRGGVAIAIATSTTNNLIAGLAGSVVLVLREAGAVNHVQALAVWLLPIATVVAAGWLTLAVGVTIGNRELADTLTMERNFVAATRRRSRDLDKRVREQLALLMHGPVQGRLSACVMALNFHLGSDAATDPERAATVTAAVIEHLAAASRDLAVLRQVSRESHPST